MHLWTLLAVLTDNELLKHVFARSAGRPMATRDLRICVMDVASRIMPALYAETALLVSPTTNSPSESISQSIFSPLCKRLLERRHMHNLNFCERRSDFYSSSLDVSRQGAICST